MSKSRGNKTSKAVRAERQAKALDLMKAGLTQKDIAAELGISRMTFWRDLQSIEARYIEGSSEDVKQFKEAQYKALLQIESAAAKGTIPPDVATVLVRVRSEVAKLLGLNAPERKVTAHINAESSPRALKLKKATAGLTDAQVDIECERMSKIPREAVVEVHDASWFPTPEPKQLGDGQ
jgi:transcriptional regulator with XRE-family HTH domain